MFVDVSSELEAMLRLELENTERLDAHFVDYLHCRGMSPAENTDSAAGSMHESHEALTPELQVNNIFIMLPSLIHKELIDLVIFISVYHS